MSENQTNIAEEIICPYPGLRPFTEEESIYFKGRDEHIEKITRILERDKFLMLTGASGDGKSSLVYAGLIPNARAGFFTAKHNEWVIADFRPERSPLLNLSAILNKQLNYESVETVLGSLSHGYSSLVDLYKNSSISQGYIESHKGKSNSSRPSNLLILVDQFEELFTNPENFFNGASSEESKTVINLLMETNAISKQEDLPIYIVCTMRSDYISYCTSFRNLPELIGESHYFVPRLNRKEIYQIIKEPAELSGCTISVRLTERLLNDLKEGMEILPVLQHALYKIWQLAIDENSSILDLIHYAKVGGMSGTELPDENQTEYNSWFEKLPHFKKQLLSKPSLDNVLNTHADELFEMAMEYYNRKHPNEPLISHDTANQVLKNSFLCLTKVDGSKAIRNRMSVTEITQVIGDKAITPAVVKGILNLYREKGNTFIRPFLSSPLKQMQSYWTEIEIGPDTVLDITHEALIRNWNLLRQWVLEEEQSVQIFNDFQIQINRWIQGNKAKEFLLSEGHLNYFNIWYHKQVPNLYWIKRYLKTRQDQIGLDKPRENGKGTSISPQEQKSGEMNVSLTIPKSHNTLEIARELEGSIHEFIGLSSRNIRLKKRLMKYSFVVISVLLIISTFSFFQTLKEKNNVLLLNKISKSDEISYRSLLLKEDDPTFAFRMAEKAYQLYPGTNAQKALMASYMQPPFYQMYKGLSGIVYSACFSKDGKNILLASQGPGKIIDLEGNVVHLLKGHESQIREASYSDNGKNILTFSDSQVKIWTSSGELVFTIFEKESSITQALISPTDNMILTVTMDNRVKLWDFKGNCKISLLGHKAVVQYAAFSKDGQFIITSSIDSTAAIWDLKGRRIHSLPCQEKVLSAEIISDNLFYITCTENSFLTLWDKSGRKIQTLNLNSSPELIKISPDQKYLLVALKNYSSQLIEISKHTSTPELKLTHIYTGHSAKIVSLSFCKDSRMFITASDDKTARLCDTTGNCIYDLKANDLYYDAEFNYDGTAVVTAHNTGQIKIWDISTLENPIFTGHSACVWSAQYSPDSKNILTSSLDHTAKLWSLDGRLITTLTGHTDELRFAVFSPDNKYILTAAFDHTAILWDRKGKIIIKLSAHKNDIYKPVFSHNSQYIVLPSRDKKASIWKISYENELPVVKFVRFLSANKGRVRCVAFSMDDKFVYTGHGDNVAYIWDENGNLVKTLEFHKGEIYDIAVSSDNKYIALASKDNNASLWTINGEFVISLEGHNDMLTSVSFSHNNNFIATSSSDNTAKLWDLKGKCLSTFNGHSQFVSTVCFSNDDQYLLTASDDKTARLWDRAGNTVNTFYGHNDVVQSAIFSPDNKSIITTSYDGTARVWPIFISDVLGKINDKKTRGNVWKIPEQEEIQLGLK